MQAVVITAPGGPEALTLSEVPSPTIGPDEVLVQVHATAINRADLLQRQGKYPPPPGASPILGLECSGTIHTLGEHVSGWQLGQPVVALLAGGGYAQQVAVPSGQLLPLPHGLDLETAAALPEAVCTAWDALAEQANLQRGESVLIHGGASGVGTMAIQIARVMGARVLVTAGSTSKLARCRELGADVTINYREEDFAASVGHATQTRGVDVIIDNMGAAYLPRNLKALAPQGRLVALGLQGGTLGELDLARLLRQRLRVLGSTLRTRTVAEKTALVTAVRHTVWPLIERGQIGAVVDRVLPLDQAAGGHRVVEAGEHVGKVVLSLADMHQD